MYGETEDQPDTQNLRIHNMDLILFLIAMEIALQQVYIVESCAALKVKATPGKDGMALQLQQDKLARDRKLITDIIRATLVEMAEAGTWQSLQDAICALSEGATETTILQQNYENLRGSIAALSKELKVKKRQHQKELLNLQQNIVLLADKKEEVSLNAKIRLIYVDKWLNSRMEDQEMQHDVPRAKLPSADHEKRVHVELCKAFELQIQEREKLLDYWRVKYADDTAVMNVTVAEKCELMKETVLRRQELERVYKLHAGEMRSWLTFKAERAARLAREERVRRSATNIQAWWRGVMVRRGLGSFKFLRSAKKTPTKSKKK